MTSWQLNGSKVRERWLVPFAINRKRFWFVGQKWALRFVREVVRFDKTPLSFDVDFDVANGFLMKRSLARKEEEEDCFQLGSVCLHSSVECRHHFETWVREGKDIHSI